MRELDIFRRIYSEVEGDRERLGRYTCESLRKIAVIHELIESIERTALTEEGLYCTVGMYGFIADVLNGMGRHGRAGESYTRAILAAQLLKIKFGVDFEEVTDYIYSAIRARNAYVDDDCDDLRNPSAVLIGQEQTEELFRTALTPRRSLRRDSVELTEEYLSVIDQVEEQLERELPARGMGSCHALWSRKRELLAQRGIDWRSPAVLNPRIRFD